MRQAELAAAQLLLKPLFQRKIGYTSNYRLRALHAYCTLFRKAGEKKIKLKKAARKEEINDGKKRGSK
jgi:hypothetical protein